MAVCVEGVVKLGAYDHPSLAYMFRSWLARQMAQCLPPGRFLEIGVGRGKFHRDLIARGFRGLCIDLNADVIEEQKRLKQARNNAVCFEQKDFSSVPGEFDLLVAFEVLEHFQQDELCLEQWKTLLRPGGALLLSVPAHMAQWTANDTQAGHFRRYEKTQLHNLLLSAGFKIELFWCYGFPLLNWSYRLSAPLKKPNASRPPNPIHASHNDSHTPTGQNAEVVRTAENRHGFPLFNEEKTASSGNFHFHFLICKLFNERIWGPILWMQKLFLNTDCGVGYMVLCSKAK